MEVDSDEPLPEELFSEWDRWKSSLLVDDLYDMRIYRPYLPLSYSGCNRKEVHIYCDASDNAIATVVILQIKHVWGSFNKSDIIFRSILGQ
jgi:hypothetical protein